MPAAATTKVRYRLPPPTVALIALAVLATLVWLASDLELHLALAIVLVLVVFLDGWFARRALRDFSLHLSPPSTAYAGETMTWGIRTQGWNRPVALQPLMAYGLGETLVDDPRPGTIVWPAMARGVIPFVILDAVASGPLGLVTSGKRIVQHFPQPVAVGPRPLTVADRWPKPIPVGFGPVEGAPVGEELFRAIRPYRRGDDRRRVDWKTTARHGTLMVRELDGTGAVTVRIEVDLGRSTGSSEWVAGVAAWMTATALRRGWQVELVTADGSAAVPAVVDPGRTFGRAPLLSNPMAATSTVAAPVRSEGDAQRRLALAVLGRPDGTPSPRGLARACRIAPDGVSWS